LLWKLEPKHDSATVRWIAAKIAACEGGTVKVASAVPDRGTEGLASVCLPAEGVQYKFYAGFNIQSEDHSPEGNASGAGSAVEITERIWQHAIRALSTRVIKTIVLR